MLPPLGRPFRDLTNKWPGRPKAATKILPGRTNPRAAQSARLGARLVAVYRRPSLRRTHVGFVKRTDLRLIRSPA